MKIKNHLAFRFLTDSNLIADIITMHMYQFDSLDNEEGTDSFINMMSPHDSKNYYVTESVIEKLSLIKLHKNGDHYNWKPLISIPEGKYTFILPDGRLYRVWVGPSVNEQGNERKIIWVGHFYRNEEDLGWDTFIVSGEDVSDNFDTPEIIACEDRIYRILLFIFLSETEEIIVQPQHRYGTKKSGKLVNDLPVPITVVNKNWNITSIRTEGFGVRGHYAIRWAGTGRSEARVVFIEPFEKKGYTRKATSTNDK